MKKLIGLAAILLLVAVESIGETKCDIRFEGKIEKMADPVPPSGVLASYRLIRYEVIRVVQGRYSGKTIVVDHPIFAGELANFHPSDLACVCLIKGKPLDRWNVPGIREPGEKVDTFYLENGISAGKCKD